MTINEETLPFWFDDGLPKGGASHECLSEFERHTGKALPASLKRLLHERDGGVSNYEAYRRGSLYVPLPAFFNMETMTRSFDTSEWFNTPDGVVAIGSGAHDWLGLDYREPGRVGVVYQEHEDAPIQRIADSFQEFLDGLVEE